MHTIRLATNQDLERLMAIVKKATVFMDQQGINQWDNVYPNKSILQQDINQQHLYLIEKDQLCLGLIALNEEQSPEYEEIEWNYKGKILVVHRLTIDPAHQGKKLASQLMAYAEKMAQSKEYQSIRLDAFKQNKAALALYDKLGYKIAGSVQFRKGEFFCYEKLV